MLRITVLVSGQVPSESVQLNKRQLEGRWPHLLMLPTISEGPYIVQDHSQTGTGHCEAGQQQYRKHCQTLMSPN